MFFDSVKGRKPRQWSTLANGATIDYDPADLNQPTVIEPRPYQSDGAAWLQSRQRAILGDDAGLGKTIQALMAAPKPILVTCPTYSVLQWADVIEQNYPNYTVAVAGVGNRQQRHNALTGGALKPGGPAPADVVIVNTDMHRTYVMPEVATWVCDEAHHFRNREAERTRLAHQLAQRTPNAYFLTATPVHKDVTNLWSLLHMIDPKYWSSYWEFFNSYAKTGGDSGWGAAKVIGIWNPKKLERELAPYLLRRTYRDVGLFLPDTIDMDVILQFDDRMRKLYDRVRSAWVYEDIPLGSQGEVLHTLRRCTVLPKIMAAKEILADNPEPTVVFCWYTDTAEDCASELNGIAITGATPADKRADIAKAAIAQGKTVVATIASLSESVDLSACKQVIQLEEDYVPGTLYQERRRFVRWTVDERPVRIHNLRIRHTIDMDVHHAVVSRRGSAQQILKDALT